MARDRTTSTHATPLPCLQPWQLGHVLPERIVKRIGFFRGGDEDNSDALGTSFRTPHAIPRCPKLPTRSLVQVSQIHGAQTLSYIVLPFSSHLVLNAEKHCGTFASRCARAKPRWHSDILRNCEIQNALNGDVEILEHGSTPRDLPWKRCLDCAWCCGGHSN